MQRITLMVPRYASIQNTVLKHVKADVDFNLRGLRRQSRRALQSQNHLRSVRIWSSRQNSFTLLFRQQQKLLKALEKLDAGSKHARTPSFRADGGKQHVSLQHRMMVRRVSQYDGCLFPPSPHWCCRDVVPQRKSPPRCTLPWKSCQTGGMPSRSAWPSCSSSATETGSCTFRLTTLTSGTPTTPGIWGHWLTGRWRLVPAAN